jgi:catechol 2,3-dioxygenase-like lactoylglutathione lyase family enzyme
MTLFMTELSVAEPDRMASWYARICGMTIVLRAPLPPAPGGGRLALKREDGEARDTKPCRLVFRVDDLEAERDRLVEAGVSVSGITANDREHYRDVRFADPEGTPITLFAWTERACDD